MNTAFQELASHEWRQWASCAEVDPDSFFPDKGGSTRDAKRICAGCAVQPECLAFAVEHRERFGIWGGLSERERQKLIDRTRCVDCSADISDRPNGARFCESCRAARRRGRAAA